MDRAFNDGSATSAANRIVDAALADAALRPEAPRWYIGSNPTGVSEVYDVQLAWFEAMRTGGLLEKMTLFWQNHFATQWTVNQSKNAASIGHVTYDYYTLLREHALGNARQLVHAIGLTPSMLLYLDGYVNEQGAANENYARELLELFSMGQVDAQGQANYTEQDIKELARALTGWTVRDNRAVFEAERHDGGTKTIFGQTGTFGYDEVIDLLFAERAEAIATFLCRKMYCFFVQARPDEGIVQNLADVLRANDFDIAPVVRTLLASAHFYDETFIAARIKSPLELLIGFFREADLLPTDDLFEYLRRLLTPVQLGHEPFNPPNVAGWPGLNPPASDGQPGHYAWLSTSALPDRWRHLETLIDHPGFDPFDLVQKISDPSDPLRIPVQLAEALLAVPLDAAGIPDLEEPFGGNPDFPPPPDFLAGPAYAVNLAKIMLNGTPFYEWPRFDEQNPEHIAEARTLLNRYLVYLVQLPAYQLT